MAETRLRFELHSSYQRPLCLASFFSPPLGNHEERTEHLEKPPGDKFISSVTLQKLMVLHHGLKWHHNIKKTRDSVLLCNYCLREQK